MGKPPQGDDGLSRQSVDGDRGGGQNGGKSHGKSRGKGKPEKGRLVWNHSTHIPDLIPLLETLLAQEAGIHTITPGALARTRSRAPQFRLKVSAPIRGGYKLIARRGQSSQEVFVVTPLSQERLEGAIAQALKIRRL